MDLSILEQYLEKLTLQKLIKYPEFDYSKGVSLLLRGVAACDNASLFLGTLSVWKSIIKHTAPVQGATYLICNDQPEASYNISPDLPANFFLLSTSVDQMLHILDRGIAKDFSFQKDPVETACRQFLEDVKNGYLNEADLARTRFASLPYPVHPHVSCIIIQSESDTLTLRQKEQIEQAITGFFPETNLFFYEKEWIVFFTQDTESTDRLNLDYYALSAMLKANSLYAALSYPCQRPDLLYNVYKSTSMALSIGLRTNYRPQISRVYPYKELNMLLVVHLSSQRFKQRMGTNNTMFLAHPDAVKVYYHDLEENDNLLEILTVYLANGQNISVCAEHLYMHRNTVHNKIKKIKELIHLDLESGVDSSLLLLSCTILQYQKNCEKMVLTDFL